MKNTMFHKIASFLLSQETVSKSAVLKIVAMKEADLEKIAQDILDRAKNARKDALVWAGLGCRPSKSNSKMGKLADMLGIPKTHVLSFDLLAGWTCPWAKECQSRVEIVDGHRRVKDGKDCTFRCYAAKLEAAFGPTYELHKANTETVLNLTRNRMVEALADEIITGLLATSPNLAKMGGVVRVHSSGDFANKYYVAAWVSVMERMQNVFFFGYTKSAELVQELNQQINAFFVHSHGSTTDDKAEALGLPQCRVKVHENDYQDLNVACETPDAPTDFIEIIMGRSFALDFH